MGSIVLNLNLYSILKRVEIFLLAILIEETPIVFLLNSFTLIKLLQRDNANDIFNHVVTITSEQQNKIKQSVDNKLTTC